MHGGLIKVLKSLSESVSSIVAPLHVLLWLKLHTLVLLKDLDLGPSSILQSNSNSSC